MARLILRHPLIFCVTLFTVMMLAAKFGITWAVDHIGGWIAVPGIVVLLLIGFWIDRRDNQRSSTG